MSSGQPYEPDYPYASRYGQPATASHSSASPIPWDFLWRWFKRATLAAAIVIALGTAILGVIGYRMVTRAMLLADLEQRGCRIMYAHRSWNGVDVLPEFLRERLGDRFFSSAVDVSAYSYWEGALSSADVIAICQECGSLKELKSFSIKSDHFTCDYMKNWPSLTKIESLNIESGRLSDADLEVIAHMSGLKELIISRARFSSEGVAKLSSLPHLEGLILVEVAITSSSDVTSSPWPSLRKIVIRASPEVIDGAWACFGTPPNLDSITIDRTPINEARLGTLMAGGNVVSLEIGEAALTDRVFELISNYSDCYSITLSGDLLTDAGLKRLADKQINELSLASESITDEGLQYLARVKDLSHLSLVGTRVTGTGVKYFDPEKPLPQLSLDGPRLTSEGLVALSKTKCTDLDIWGSLLGDNELMLFVNQDEMTQLNITSTQVTSAGLLAFLKARKKRLRGSGREESLAVISDHSEVTDAFFGYSSGSAMPGDPTEASPTEPMPPEAPSEASAPPQ